MVEWEVGPDQVEWEVGPEQAYWIGIASKEILEEVEVTILLHIQNLLVLFFLLKDHFRCIQ